MCVSNLRTAVLKTLLHLTWGFSEMHAVAFASFHYPSIYTCVGQTHS